MNAEQYKSITGLCNYEGFKSNLKNSRLFGNFNCLDETIVFNQVRTISNEVYPLSSEQVGVVLNLSAPYAAGVPTPVIATDSNNVLLDILSNSNVIGMLVGKDITCSFQSITIAIFDLY